MTQPKRRSVDRLADQSWMLYVIVVALIAGAYTVALVSDRIRSDHEVAIREKQARDLACIKKWADATTARSEVLSAYSNARNAALTKDKQALAKLFDEILAKAPPARVQRAVVAYDKAVNDFLRADAAYNKAFREHPIPVPTFDCADAVAAAGGTSVAPSPTPSAVRTTATVRSTATATVVHPTTQWLITTAPGGEVTIVRPGPVRTVTRTRTVSPPSCLEHPLPPCVLKGP